MREVVAFTSKNGDQLRLVRGGVLKLGRTAEIALLKDTKLVVSNALFGLRKVTNSDNGASKYSWRRTDGKAARVVAPKLIPGTTTGLFDPETRTAEIIEPIGDVLQVKYPLENIRGEGTVRLRIKDGSVLDETSGLRIGEFKYRRDSIEAYDDAKAGILLKAAGEELIRLQGPFRDRKQHYGFVESSTEEVPQEPVLVEATTDARVPEDALV